MYYYYLVKAKQGFRGGKGTSPDIPAGISWIGEYDDQTKEYFIKTNTEIDPDYPGVKAIDPDSQQFEQECEKRGLNPQDVKELWRLGGE